MSTPLAIAVLPVPLQGYLQHQRLLLLLLLHQQMQVLVQQTVPAMLLQKSWR